MSNHQLRITSLEMSGLQIVVALANGNIGAVNVCAQIMKVAAEVDPRSALGAFGPLFMFDTYGIYEDRIWMLYKDVCKQDIRKTIAMLRALQLGIVTATVMDHAIDHYGEGLDVDATCASVKERLPEFQLVAPAETAKAG